jgi:hypothetical protein
MIAGTELLTKFVYITARKIEMIEHNGLSLIVPTSIFVLFAINLIMMKLMEME